MSQLDAQTIMIAINAMKQQLQREDDPAVRENLKIAIGILEAYLGEP